MSVCGNCQTSVEISRCRRQCCSSSSSVWKISSGPLWNSSRLARVSVLIARLLSSKFVGARTTALTCTRLVNDKALAPRTNDFSET
jgi:hypothetical protein